MNEIKKAALHTIDAHANTFTAISDAIWDEPELSLKEFKAAALYTDALEKLGFTVLDSRSNFLFASKPGTDGGAIYRGLKERGVLVRHFDKDPIRDYNRITIGTPEQMDIFLTKLEELL